MYLGVNEANEAVLPINAELSSEKSSVDQVDKVNQVDRVAELTKAVGDVNVDSGWGNTFMQSVLLQKPEFVNIFQFYRIRISIFGPIWGNKILFPIFFQRFVTFFVIFQKFSGPPF